MLTYRIGWPGWKFAFKLGMTMSYRYEIVYDIDCKRYVGVSPDIKGLVAECDTIDEVKAIMEGNAPEIVAYQVFGAEHKKGSYANLVPHSRLGEGLVHG